MRGRTSSIKISLTSEQRETKESWLRRQRPLLDWPNALVLLLAEESASAKPVNGLDSENAICESGQDFIERGVEGLQDRPRPGRVRFFPLKWRCIW